MRTSARTKSARLLVESELPRKEGTPSFVKGERPHSQGKLPHSEGGLPRNEGASLRDEGKLPRDQGEPALDE